MHDKWLPVESVHMILLSVDSLGRKHNRSDSLGRKPFIAESSLERKQEIMDRLGKKPNMTDSLGRKQKLAD